MRTLLPGLALASLLSACATVPRPAALDEVERVRVGAAVTDARVHAPQAHARAELIFQRANAAYEAKDLTVAQVLSEQALAAYTGATIEARLARSEKLLAEARLAQQTAAKRLAELDAEQQKLVSEAADLELRAKILQEAVPLAKSAPASAEREKARREAARAILTQGSLLCVSARLVEPGRAELTPLLARTEQLRQQLGTAAATPIDEATQLRSACLRQLTLARRPRAQANPAQGESDALLAELSRADLLPFRDDRGVVVTLRDLVADGKLSERGRELLATLGRVASAHAAFPVLVVTHDARPSGKDASGAKQSEQVKAALEAAGAARVELRAAGTDAPVVPPERPGAAARNARTEVVFVSPGN